MRVHLLTFICSLTACLTINRATAQTPNFPTAVLPTGLVTDGQADEKKPVHSQPILIAVGPVMRPSSPNQPITSPSTGPASTPSPIFNPLPTTAPTDLQQDTSPTTPSVLPGQTTGLPETMTPPSQGKIEPLTIPPGQQLPVPLKPEIKGTITSGDQPSSGNQGISLSEALDEALIRSPRAAAVRAQLPIAKSGIAQATITPNPVFFMDRGFVAEDVERRGPSVTWEPPFKLWLRMLAAKRLYDQTKIDLMTTLWQLRADTRRAYTEAVVARETQKTLQDLYELSNRLLIVSSKRFQAGDVPELDVLRARLSISQSQVDLGVGEQRVVRAAQQLNVILGRQVENAIGVPALPDFTGKHPTAFQLKAIKRGILPDFSKSVPPLQEFLKIAFDNRLELKSLAQQIKVNDMNFKNAIGAAVPNPSLAYGSSTNGNLPSGPKLRATFMTLNAELPVTNLNQGDIAKFKAIGKQLVYQVAAQKNQVIADVSSAYNNLLAAREKIRVYQEHVLADSAEVARLSRRSYEVGQSDINSTLLAQQANVQIRSQYLDAVTTYQGAYTDLEQACGTSLD